MKKVLFCILMLLVAGLIKAQMPGAITIEPPDATAYDMLTLTFDPDFACFQSGSLAGLESIAMHSGVSYVTGETWQHIIEYNENGVNGQPNTLMPTGDGRFSITYTPANYYGLTGEIVTQICAVFNNGDEWSQDGRDFSPDSVLCMDFFIPLKFEFEGQFLHVPWDYPTIQEGINAAADGHIVLVAPGTYYENINFKGKAITLGSHYLIDPYSNYITNTIIDGSQPANIDSASVVYFISGEDTSSVLCGFSLIYGNGTFDQSLGHRIGGGILCSQSGPTLKSLKVMFNSAGQGGGIMCNNAGHVKIGDTDISNNWAEFEGGGLSCISSNVSLQNVSLRYNNALSLQGGGISFIESTGELQNSAILENQALFGAGIYSSESGLNIINTLVSKNTGFKGGGLYAINTSLNCEDTDFYKNDVTGNGGGIYYWKIEYEPNNYELNLLGCSFYMNSANEAAAGLFIGSDEGTKSSFDIKIDHTSFSYNQANRRSALYIFGADVNFDIRNSVFDNNEATTYIAGASLTYLCQGKFYNCLFYSNHAALGGGDYNSGGACVWSQAAVDFINCSFADNTASYGSALTIAAGAVTNAVNCIYWGNANGQIALDTYESQGGILTIEYSDLQYGIDSIQVSALSTLNWGEGNIDYDPLFDESGDYPLAILPGSPCIDAGIPDTTGLNLPEGDIIGNIRIWDGDNNGTAVIDMGAYEFGSLPVGISLPSALKPVCNLQTFPNPFHTYTTLEYEITQASTVQLCIYNHLGKKVKTVITAYQYKGKHQVILNGTNLSPGIYFCTLKTNKGIQTVKLIKL